MVICQLSVFFSCLLFSRCTQERLGEEKIYFKFFRDILFVVVAVIKSEEKKAFFC